MIPDIVYIILGVVVFLIILFPLAKLVARRSNSRSSQLYKVNGLSRIASHRTRGTRQNGDGQPTSNERHFLIGEERNEIRTEAGLVHLEYNSRTAQSYNNHRPTGLTVSNRTTGALDNDTSDRINGELNNFSQQLRSA